MQRERGTGPCQARLDHFVEAVLAAAYGIVDREVIAAIARSDAELELLGGLVAVRISGEQQTLAFDRHELGHPVAACHADRCSIVRLRVVREIDQLFCGKGVGAAEPETLPARIAGVGVGGKGGGAGSANIKAPLNKAEIVGRYAETGSRAFGKAAGGRGADISGEVWQDCLSRKPVGARNRAIVPRHVALQEVRITCRLSAQAAIGDDLCAGGRNCLRTGGNRARASLEIDGTGRRGAS